MHREFKGVLQTTMTPWQWSMICGVSLLLGACAANLHAQAAVEDGEKPCFAIHVSLNGKQLDGPQTVIFKTDESENAVTADGGCLRLPPALLTEKFFDIQFTVPRNRVSLTMMPTRFLAGPWDIDLEDKRFGRNVVMPKHARTRGICAIIFHFGEPETIATFNGCRTPF